MSIIIGNKGNLRFSRPKQTLFVLPESSINPETSSFSVVTQTWFTGDRAWIIHNSLDYKVSILSGYIYHNKASGFMRLHQTESGAFQNNDETLVDLSEITSSNFILAYELGSVQLGKLYPYLELLPAVTQQTLVNEIVASQYEAASLSEGNNYVFQGNTTSWTLNLSSEAIDTHALGERFKTISKDIVSGSGVASFVVDFSDSINRRGVEAYIEFISIFSDRPDANAKFFLLDAAGEKKAIRDDTGSRYDGDYYYNADVLFTDITYEVGAEGLVTGSVSFVCTGPIRLLSKVDEPTTFEDETVESTSIPLTWVSSSVSGNGFTYPNGNGAGLTVDRYGNSYVCCEATRSDNGQKYRILTKRNLAGTILWTKYMDGNGLDWFTHLAVSPEGDLVVTYPYVFYIGTELVFIVVYDKDGNFKKEGRLYNENGYGKTGQMRVNPVTGHVYILFYAGSNWSTLFVYILDKDLNFVKVFRPAFSNTLGMNDQTVAGLIFDEMGNCIFLTGAYSAPNYFIADPRYTYSTAFKTTADGVFIHKMVYYGSLENGGYNLRFRYTGMMSTGEFIALADTNLVVKLSADLVPIAAKTLAWDMDFVASDRNPTSYHTDGKNITVGLLHTFRESDLRLERQRFSFYANSSPGASQRFFHICNNMNRYFAVSDDNGLSVLTSNTNAFQSENIRYATNYLYVDQPSDTATNWKTMQNTPIVLPDATTPPFLQTTQTEVSVSTYKWKYVKTNPEEGESVKELTPPDFVPRFFGSTPVQPKSYHYKIFRFKYQSTMTVPDGYISYGTDTVNTTWRGTIPVYNYDLNGQETKNFFLSLPIGSVLLLRVGNENFTPFTIRDFAISSQQRLYIYSHMRLTGFPAIANQEVLLAIHPGSIDPMYPYPEIAF